MPRYRMRSVLNAGSSFFALFFFVACSGTTPAKPFSPDCARREAGTHCIGERFVECGEDGSLIRRDNCGAEGLVCDEEVGCQRCHPGAYHCEGNSLYRCDAQGNALEHLVDCEEGLQCSALGCRDLCADARDRRSYVGCEYHALVTMNSSLYEGFSFALAIGNDELIPAEIRIYRGETMVERAEIAPQSMDVIRLPWVEGLRAPEEGGSAWVPKGAYRIESNVPVMVHQFNPLDYRISCPIDEELTGSCYSHTNDASLLLPDHVLGKEYFVMARPSFAVNRNGDVIRHPGFVAITSLEEEPVEIVIEPKGKTHGSADATVPPLDAGEPYRHVLERGDVLQIVSAPFSLETPGDCPGEAREETLYSGSPNEWELIYCDAGPSYDLTGTRIRASGRISVVSGHDCTFIPYDRWACDHLEEALFPVQSWGKRVFSPRPSSVNQEPYLLRILSAEDGNEVELNGVAPFRLDAGEYREFSLESDRMITASKPILAAQFFVGQGVVGGKGDPGMALLPPIEQWRSKYAFLRVANFELGYVSVAARTGVTVLIDGEPITKWTDHPSGYSTARVSIGPGFHEARSEDGSRFGLMLYGYADYTSYFLPAGLDVEPIYIGPPG